MSQSEEILALLDDLKPKALCDDCLSEELDIQPRQTVNVICRSLNAGGVIARIKTECDRCGKAKITNGFVGTPARKTPAIGVTARDDTPTVSINDSSNLDIEKARTEIVRICRTLWKRSKEGDPPRGLATLINLLRNESVLPNHEANMMLTLCNLRNVHVYEGLKLQARELSIAIHAQAIVNEWWAKQRG